MAWPSTIPTSSTVWCGSIAASPVALTVKVEPGMLAPGVEHVIEEGHARLGMDVAGAVEVQGKLDRGLSRDGGRAKPVELAVHWSWRLSWGSGYGVATRLRALVRAVRKRCFLPACRR